MFRFSIDWSLSSFIFYVIVGVSVSLLCKMGTQRYVKNKLNVYFIFAFVILFLVESLRSVNVGTDTEEYVELFKNTHLYGFDALLLKSFEPLFSLYIYITSRVTDSYFFLFACNAFIKQTAFIIYVKNYWKKGDSFQFLPLFIINFQYELSAMRSALAVAFILYSLVLLDNGKQKLSILSSVVAIGFHTTAIFSLAIVVLRLFLLRINDKVSIKLLVLLMLTAAFVINGSVVILQSFVQENTSYGSYVEELGSGWLGYWYLYIAAAISISFLSKEYKRKERFNTNYLVNILMIGCLPIFVVLGAYRIPKYFLMCRNVTFKDYYTSILIKQSVQQSRLLIKFCAFILLIILLLFFSGRMNSGSVYELNPLFTQLF